MTSPQGRETNRGRRRTGVATKTGVERIIDLVKKCRFLRRREHATCRNRFCGEQNHQWLEAAFSLASRG
jgi:hypothetical protein